MSEGEFSWIERLKQIPGQASALGKRGMDAIRAGASHIADTAKAGYEAGRAGGFSGAFDHAAKTAEAGYEAGMRGGSPAGQPTPSVVDRAQDLGKRGTDAIRSAAAQVGEALPKTAADVGRVAGDAVNAAGDAVNSAKTAASEAATGFRTATSGISPQPSPGALGAEPPVADASRFTGKAAGFQKDAISAAERVRGAGGAGIPPGSPPGMLRKAAGFLGRAAIPAAAGIGVLGAASDQLDNGEVSMPGAMESATGSDVFASSGLVKNRLERLGGLAKGAVDGLNPLNMLPDSVTNAFSGKSAIDRRGKNFGVPQSPRLGQQPVQPGAPAGAGPVPTNQGEQTPDQLIDGTAVPMSGRGAFRRESGARRIDPKTGADLGPIGAQGRGPATSVGGGAMFGGLLPDLPKNATPEQANLYLQKSQALQDAEVRGRDALRKDLVQIQGGGRSPFDVGSGAAGAIAGLSAYGAMSRMQKNEADLGVRQEANSVARQKAAFDMAAKNREDLRGQQKINRETMEKELEDYGRTKAGPQGNLETSPAYETRVKGELSKVRQDINYSLGNRKDGRKLEDLEPAERQQLLVAKSIKDRVEASRGDIGQSLRDFLGNKRFDSKDLYSYMPKNVEPTMTGGYKVVMNNGNTMTVTRAVDGSNNWFGPNGPVDADVMQLISPLVDKYEKSQKGK